MLVAFLDRVSSVVRQRHGFLRVVPINNAEKFSIP